MRPKFFQLLYDQMKLQKGIWLLVGDLGYGGVDTIQTEIPDRFVNCGASEFATIGFACGLAMTGKVSFVYSITNFLLYRPFEIIRNYLNYDNIPVKLIGSGRGKEYEHDGISHWSEDAKHVLDCLPNVVQYWPETNEEMETNFKELLDNDKPCFLSLKR
jgi:transketolase